MKFFLILMIFLISNVNAENVRTINVEGVVEKSFRPDIVSMNVTVWAKSDKAKDALRMQVEFAKKVKEIISKFKIESKDVMTLGFDVAPDYLWDQKSNQNTIAGYNVTETISVTLKEIETVGKFIDEISIGEKKSGVNISNIAWSISNREEIQKELMAEAFKVAQLKAEILAKAAAVKIKRVYQITPGSNQIYNPPMANLKMMGADSLEHSTPSLQSGQVKVSSLVNVNYEIE